MHIGFLSSEVAPFVQTGGLGDVSRWLPAKLASGGDRVDVALPFYDVLDTGGLDVVAVRHPSEVSLGELGTARFFQLDLPRPDHPTVWLVDAPEWFHRGTVYDERGDGHLRYTVLVRAALALAQARNAIPDVVHANDWHTAHAPLAAASFGGRWSNVPTVLTLHNLAFQGWFETADLAAMGLDAVVDRMDPDDIGRGWVSTLKEGIRSADLVTTVSPTYAREITTPQGGMGLDGVLRAKGDRLVGILNGIGDDWDPRTDPDLAAPFSRDDMTGKAENTAALRVRMGLVERDVPILGIVSRLTEQKGFGLVGDVLDRVLGERRAQLAVIGTGAQEYEQLFAALRDRFPGDAVYYRGFDVALSHLIEAGSDIFLMPSRFEPSGLNQMYSMAYGTIPVVHATGGLIDSVEPFDAKAGTGCGFVFSPHTVDAFARCLDEAIAAWGDPAQRWRVIANGMARDDSWDARADEYRKIYRRAVSSRE